MKGLRIITAALALSASAIAAGAGQGDAYQRLVLRFDMFAPADLRCVATGDGVRSHSSRDLAGKPVLRVTGNAAGADITCSRPDGSHYRLTANQNADYWPNSPTEATVTFVRGKPAMTTVLRIDGRQEVYDFKSFVRVD